jgi:NTP pyrophosphatase (non-canonical NTP hydrolase)
VEAGVSVNVFEFAGAMSKELERNSHKGGWSRETYGYLLNRLKQEVAELRRAVRGRESPESVLSEAADVANFAMMIADVYSEREDPENQ